MSRFTVIAPDFSGDQVLVLLRDNVTGIEHYRGVTDVMRTTVIDELPADDIEYIKRLRIEQDGGVRPVGNQLGDLSAVRTG